MKLELNKIYHGHVLDVLRQFPDDSVDLLVTSPPYYNLRKYGDDELAPIWDNNPDCEHDWRTYIKRGVNGGMKSAKNKTKGSENFQSFDDSTVLVCKKCDAMKCELGQELSSTDFINHLVEIFRECRRVLKPTGTLWVNMGDSYMGSGGKNCEDDIEDRSLMLIPQRMMAALVEDGWIMRNDIIWYKPDAMCRPTSTKNTPSHEHIYVMGYFPWFAQKQQYHYKQLVSPLKTKVSGGKREYGGNKHNGYGNAAYSGRQYVPNVHNVKNMRDTWLIKEPIMDIWEHTTAKYTGSHFAVFPIELPQKAIEAGCPKEICTKCGQPVKYELSKVYEGEATYKGKAVKAYEGTGAENASEVKRRAQQSMVPKKWDRIACECNAGFEPGVVLDPFMGAGTTAIAALKEKVNYIGIELFKENIELAEDRIKNFFPMKDSESLWEI
jgi:DNA modification methylase